MVQKIIRVKQDVLAELVSFVEIGETLEAAIPCGPVRVKQGALERAGDRDYFVLTSKKIMHIRGDWFRTKKDDLIRIVNRSRIAGVNLQQFLLGSTLTFSIADENNPYMRCELKVENCGKPEGEAVSKALQVSSPTKTCPACGKPLEEQFAFCPYCKFSLRRVCQRCGRELREDWIGCPYCGG